MEILLNREQFGDKSTIGTLTIDGNYECVTLEDTDRHLEDDPSAKIQNETAIPRGTYNVVKHMSPHFNRFVPMLENVPNYTTVYIHWGNSDVDTDGCILVGTTVTNIDFISQSVLAFNNLYEKIENAWNSGEDVTITVQ